MAHSAKLYLEGEELIVQEFHWAVVQFTDAQSRPQNSVLAGKISLVIDKLQHPLLDAWMADARKQLSGLLVADAPDGLGTARSLRFVDALCVSQELHFTAGGDGQFAGSMTIVLTARQLHIESELVIDNHWPV
ncbi:type VI secretion system tube protein TssD [Hymenobacter sp. H14-R3]|uniref:type VI secretion system tube protein TssD n=1 Tax=Hymenobacter sp. H14-R3 TaxID=3046308 RepID=UPI0024B930A6|nr:type VI secretion system tube protein TssD [Hymenobacter sp. H14-R3]MDJ0364700.1 type VI secretion system tube protein TssD [Hymenobacter sp. H14-R3]